ncbi:MAG TPA: ATP-binding protein [Candidatus Limnocylindrales bacterium]|nr:ATP-binding protein [Candidatus Limnocylindrales bacterium]
MLDAVPEAVLVFDPEGRVRFANPAVDRLFPGRPVVDHRDLMGRFEPLPAGTPAEGTLLVRPTRTPNRWFELRSVPLGRGTHSEGRILVLRDVTTTQEHRADRRAYLSILSHELRTPITTIYAGSRLLARKVRRGSPSTDQIATDISVEAARLYDLVEDLLALTRLEREMLELTDEPVSLPRVAESAVRATASRAPNVPVIIGGAIDPPAVHGDAAYVEHVFRNLLASATRFGGPGSPVIVRIEPKDGEVAVRVLDRRRDASPATLDMTFALVDEPTAPRRLGLGIPLFVCRRLVEAMGGRVWARPREGGGAELGFALRPFGLVEGEA